MKTLNKVVTGIQTYLDAEMMQRMTGINKWIIGTGMAMYLDNASNIFNDLKQNEMVKALAIINEADEIDVDKIYNYLIKEAMKCPATFKLPFVGNVTLHAEDVEKIYTHIMNA